MSLDPEEDMEQVSRRVPFLLELEEGPLSRRELADRLDVSRATAHRATESMEELGLVERSRGFFELAPLGRAAVLSAKKTRRAIEAGKAMDPFLRNLDAPVLLENLHLFYDAEVFLPDSSDTLRVENRIIDALEEADSRRAACHFIWSRGIVETTRRRVKEGMDYELVIPSHIWRSLREDYGDLVEELSSMDNLSVFVNDEIPFCIQVVDEGLLQIPAFDEKGGMVALAETDTEDAVDWADLLFYRLKKEGERVV